MRYRISTDRYYRSHFFSVGDLIVLLYLELEKNNKKTSPLSWPSSAHERPAAALSRQGFISPKIDWVSQSTLSEVRSYCAPYVAK
jgi:hypothetical protein